MTSVVAGGNEVKAQPQKAKGRDGFDLAMALGGFGEPRGSA
jgi:hypothetical protein